MTASIFHGYPHKGGFWRGNPPQDFRFSVFLQNVKLLPPDLLSMLLVVRSRTRFAWEGLEPSV